ncbi:MAG: phospholipid carrier-dependent glycosyltransferase [Candidatus Eisenbacteria bacterium]|uniref:Phospholipid carrier-dependent glycosyltransferase n=1 Tax=Eiseniibacteriota bacterium TaxID=2212470 RepID=A0A956RND3_UNCEI|nr:phospholipid carrier-dependent glycosyltransferase [Candidatus Eisenbacteria bacterium]
MQDHPREIDETNPAGPVRAASGRTPTRRLPLRRPGVIGESYLLLVFALALVARMLVARFPADAYMGTGLLFDQLGLRIAVGLGMGPTALLPPLYPEYLGLLYRTYGYSHHAVVASHALLGALSATLTGLFVRYVGLGRKYAFLAGVLVALFPQALAQTRHLSPQILVGFLFLVGAFLWLRHRSRPRWFQVTIAGLLFGLAILGRAGLFVPIAAIAVAPRPGSGVVGRRFVLLLLVLSTTVPWMIRNSRLHEEPVLVDSTWAMRLQAATIPGSHHIDYRVPGRGTLYADHMEVLENRLALAEIIGFGLTRPATVVGVWLRRVQDEISFSGWNDAATRDLFPYHGIAYRWAQALMFGTLLTLALAWLILLRGWGERERACAIVVLAFTLLAAVGDGPGDARLYALPFLTVLAMRGAWGLLVLSRVRPFAAGATWSERPFPSGVMLPSRMRVFGWLALCAALWVHGFWHW